MEKIKNEKFDDITETLDLFQGQLSLNDILNQEIPFITNLKLAKMRLNTRISKERAKRQAIQQNKG